MQKHHTHFAQEFEALKNNIEQMSHLVDSQVEFALSAMESGDLELCKLIKNRDEQVDAYDVLIQSQCENLLALFQPVARELRYIISALLINNNLERCGDLAVNMANKVKKTSGFKAIIDESQLLSSAKHAREMVRIAIDSFLHSNPEIARKVIEMDDIIDKYNKSIFKFLVEKMQSNPESIEACSHLIILNKSIERLGDHATNIAEEVIFNIEAQIISHSRVNIK